MGAPSATVVAVSVTDPDAAKLVKSALSRIETPESDQLVLVHNAGFAEFGRFHEQALDTVTRQVSVMMLAPVAMTHALLPDLLQANGQVVFVGSICSEHTFADSEAYTAAKYGLLGFARVLSASYRKEGLRVTTVIPGSTDTPIWTNWSPPKADMLSAVSVAGTIAHVIALPKGQVIDEITVTPQKGIL
jgi:short-subunit dehydrogenase